MAATGHRPRAYLVDASIYVFRAWFTYPDDLADRDGWAANAVHGFTDFLEKNRQIDQPTTDTAVFLRDGQTQPAEFGHLFPELFRVPELTSLQLLYDCLGILGIEEIADFPFQELLVFV